MLLRCPLTLAASLLAFLPGVAAASYPNTYPSAGGGQKSSPSVSFALTGGPGFGLAPSHEWSTSCPSVSNAEYDWSPSCSASKPIGFFADARLGLLWGVLGVDVFVLGAGDWTEADLADLPPVPLPDYASQMNIGRLGVGAGAGLRFTTKAPSLRFSAGAGGGVMLRHVYSNVSSLGGETADYAVPMIRADVGAVSGAFTLGIMGWVELLDQVTLTPDLSSLGPEGAALSEALTDVAVFEGPEFFIGPFIGMQLGG